MEHLSLDIADNGVATMILRRPEVRNAFNAQLISELTATCGFLAGRRDLRMVVLRGEGAAFSAGADLAWMQAAAGWTKEENERDALALAEMLRSLYELPQMTLAIVHGVAMGGGLGLLAACDVAIAHHETNFSFSEVRLGLTPATISPYVIEAIGPKWARALFVTADSFDAERARELGLVHYVVADNDELAATLHAVTDRVLDAAPSAVAVSKELVRAVSNRPNDSALDRVTASKIAAQRVTDDGVEGIAAFLGKRRPMWAPNRS